ncbi:MAG: SemiSWEET transporter [Flavobacteriaceae bacterium]
MTVWQTEIIGLMAAFLTTIGFIPQAIKMIKTKDVSGISLSMYLVLIAGVLLWLTYGILLKSIAIIAANVVSFFLQLWIILMKLKHR